MTTGLFYQSLSGVLWSWVNVGERCQVDEDEEKEATADRVGLGGSWFCWPQKRNLSMRPDIWCWWWSFEHGACIRLKECPFLNTKSKVLKLGNLKGSPWNCQTNPREPLWRERIPLLWPPSEQHTEAIGRYTFQDVRRCERWFVPHPEVFRYVEIFHFFDMLQSIPGERRGGSGGSRGSRGRSRGLEKGVQFLESSIRYEAFRKWGYPQSSSIFMRILHETIQHPAIKAYPDHGNPWLVVLRRKLWSVPSGWVVLRRKILWKSLHSATMCRWFS